MLLAALAANAPNASADGTISGRVTSSTTSLGIAGTKVWAFSMNDDVAVNTTVDGSGNYSLSLPAGSYGVFTQNTQGYINEIWNNVQCSAVCDLEAITPLDVTTGAITNIDFVLDPGGRIAGRVTSGGVGIPGITVTFYDPSGEADFTSAVTDSDGNYISDGGTATGSIFVRTENDLGYQDEVWNDIKCLWCDATEGTPVPVTNGVTTGNIDFALDLGGRIAGTITDGTTGIPNVSVVVHGTDGSWIMSATTDGSGQYLTAALPAGSYYVTTWDSGRVDEIYNNVTCIGGYCNMTGGTTVAVTVGNITNNVNFALAAGGTITGTVTNAAGGAPLDVFVGVFNSSGGFIGGGWSGESGVFEIVVPAGSYYVAVTNAGYAGQVYNGVGCLASSCNVVTGTLVPVSAGGTTGNVNFALVAGGNITGTVTAAATASPVTNYAVQLMSTTNTVLATIFTDGAGVYTFTGVTAGSYYVRTNGVGFNLINQLYNGVQCIGCNVTTSGGTLVSVSGGATTSNINFALAAGGRISGTVRNATNNAPIANIGAQIFTSTGVQLSTHNTNGSGVYTTSGLPAGTYYIRTSNSLGFINEVYNDLSCPQAGCTVTNGTPITVTLNNITSNIDFSLAVGGVISGTVTNAAGGAALTNLPVQIFNAVGASIGTVNTNGAGLFTTSGLPAATYYLRTNNSAGFIDELYDNIACPSTAACNVTTGTAVSVTAGATTSDRNFALSAGGSISGTVRNASTLAAISGINVQAYASTGSFVKTGTASAADGTYTISGLPPGTYYIRTAISGAIFYLDELYNELPCSPTCVVTTGAPIVVTAGTNQTGKDFTLAAGGGAIAGTVRDAQTLAVLSGITVQVYDAGGTLAKSVATLLNSGTYAITGLPAGTYYARTNVASSVSYLNQRYDDLPCPTNCPVTSGTPIVVSNGATTGGIDFELTPSLVQNGSFGAGTAGWKLFGAPNDTYMTWNTTGGSFNLRRTPQPAGTPVSQALLFQDTGIAVPTDTPVVAQFDLANTASKVMVMRVLLVGNSANFGLDFAACTFALPNDGLFRTYQMKAHATTAWPNAAVYFYAGQIDPNGGDYYYKVDNVSLALAPGQSIERTECVDPLAPAPAGGADSANLLVNGDFSAGMANWGEDGAIVRRDPMVGGVYEAYRTAVFRPPVVLQKTNPALQPGGMLPAGQRLTLTLRLGNTLPSRARALVLVNDNDFSSFVACAFWLGPNQALSPFAMQIYTSEAWQNPAVSVYPSSGAVAPGWLQLDDVVLQKTPGTSTSGSVCLEGSEASALMALSGLGGAAFSPLLAAVVPPVAPTGDNDRTVGAGDDGPSSSAGGLTGDAAARLGDEPLASPDDTWTQDGDAWTTTAPEAGTLHVLRWT
ncbi:MAG: carboxypeptidase regulatory-like domain-containing protein, partial [Acidobacteria bacterium]|nr:carboxypeptidase regulatory-like domain-containing protein [Acidobacteriota bacterium]